MAQSACAVLGERIVDGVATGVRGSGELRSEIEWIDGTHPLPDWRSVRSASRAMTIAGQARAADRELLVLLSGGASAMLAAPAHGISLDDKREVTGALLRAGADIQQLNCVRKHLSLIKGGRLAAAAGRCRTLAISDVHVPEDDSATIGSGPTTADPTTYEHAIGVLTQLQCVVPRAVRTHLERGAAGKIEETPKPGDSSLARSQYKVIANRRTAMKGAAREARRRGYVVRVIDAPTRGEARDAGRRLVEIARATQSGAGPMCLIASGETTVTVKGSGRGGRNQEFVLGAAEPLSRGWDLALLASVGTDGVDGPTDASGAIASPATMARLAARGIDLRDVLARNDSYPVLDGLDDLVRWGPTLTNVGDVHILLTMRA